MDEAESANEYFTADHRACDEAYAKLEETAQGGDAQATQTSFTAFEAMMKRHLAMEEEVLFPALEDATGMRGVGPTAVMRHEHQQMRALLAQMHSAAEAGDAQGVLDGGDTLLMLIQQHNAKEENVLYPLADARLASAWPALAAKLAAFPR